MYPQREIIKNDDIHKRNFVKWNSFFTSENRLEELICVKRIKLKDILDIPVKKLLYFCNLLKLRIF